MSDTTYWDGGKEIVVRRYRLPFFTIEKEFKVDKNGKKTKTRQEIYMYESDQDINKSAKITLIGSISFAIVCSGLSKLLKRDKK